jgi:hypothetical protein
MSVAPLVVGDQTVGAMTVYDDATTDMTVKANSWRLVGLIDSGLKGWL